MEEWRREVVATTNLINAIAKALAWSCMRLRLIQIHWRADYAGQDRDWRRRERRTFDLIMCREDGVLAGLLCCEMVARRGKPLGEQLKTLLTKLVPIIRNGRTSA